jgi:hypothetical protein
MRYLLFSLENIQMQKEWTSPKKGNRFFLKSLNSLFFEGLAKMFTFKLKKWQLFLFNILLFNWRIFWT